MLRPSPSSLACLAAVVFLPPLLCGCTPFGEYIQNGFKVGPNYHQPPAPVAPEWIDAADERVRQEADDPSKWWTVFNDPVLDDLVCRAYRQNLTLREAAFRVLQARAQLAIARGNLFAQSQTMTGDFRQIALSLETANSVIPTPAGPVPLNQFFPQWDYGFNLGWELDFWGRIRRAIESDSATLDASAADYDDVLVTLLGDVATNYVQLRTIQQRIKVARDNAAIQRDTLRIAEQRFKAGTVDASVPHQARSTLKQTEAEIPELEIGLRQTSNRLCVLLGMPPAALQAKLDSAPIPTAPPEAVVGIPADLLRRRPDVRRAERLAAAQSARIGVAEAEFYPHIAITGTLGYSAKHFPNLFRSQALNGEIGPSFQWNILNYGRIRNGVRYEDARFQELVAAYQQTVLRRS
jgi:NodT family efflux transporter outer membrane factor (OMF) lipoprotein